MTTTAAAGNKTVVTAFIDALDHGLARAGPNGSATCPRR